MKLNRNFVQISLTALITSAVFIIPMASSRTGLLPTSPPQSQRISWSTVDSMQKEYLEFRPLRVRNPENDSRGDKQDLKGFVFNADQLREILDANKSGQRPDSVYFLFGQQGKFGDDHFFGILHDSGNIRMVAVGMKGKKLLNTNGMGGTEISVFDKADPCPPNCPE